MPGVKVHLNGQLVPADQAAVNVADAGLLHGASAFTTMLAHNGRIFRLDRHIERLMATVEFLSLRIDPDLSAEEVAAAAREVLAANGLSEARMRITLTPGSVREPPEAPPTVLITADPLPDYPPQWYDEGVRVVVASFKQVGGDPTFGHKTGCYLPRVLARREAAAKGAEEALWFTADNRLAEACFCNVFLAAGGKLATPPADTPVLPGVVRGAVIELCGELGIDCDTRTPLTVQEMLAAEEMFLTASCSGIRPVVGVERHTIGDGKPGRITRNVMSAYRELLERECPGPRDGEA